MNVSPEELSILCSCTVRYAVGLERGKTIPSTMYVDIIKRLARDMTPIARKTIADDIREGCIFGEVEDQQEEAEWLRLAEFLEAMG